MHFEAGAISKTIENSRVVPMLFDLNPSDIIAPLDQFQASIFDEAGVRNVLRSINTVAGEEGLGESHLEQVFIALRPQFAEVISTLEPKLIPLSQVGQYVV